MAATSRNSDINLLIRAKEEGVAAVQKALDNLFDSQGNLKDGAASLATALASVDKAVSTVTAAADKGSAAFDRQQAALAKAKSDLEAVKLETGSAAEVLAKLVERQNQIGPQLGGPQKLAEQIKLVSTESTRLTNDATKLERQIGVLDGALNRSRSTLLELGATERAAGEAQARVREELERTTAARELAAAAIEKQKAAESRAAATQAFFAPKTAATDAGATFSALDGQEAATAKREAAHAYELFEARVRSGAAAMREEAAAEKAAATDALATQKREAAHAYELFEARVRSGAAALKAEGEAERQADAAARQLRDDLNPLAAAQQRVNDQQRLANDLYAKGRITSAELAQQTAKLAEDLKRVNATGGKDKNSIGFLGLRPYELTNLGYQVNDVATQLASGTSLAQTFAQQGGQILQLFPKISAGIFAAFSNPLILTFIATVGVAAIALKSVADRAEQLRALKAALDASADGATYNAKALQQAAIAAEHYGVSADDATAALKVFVQEGVAPDRIAQFTRVAGEMAQTLGVDVPTAAKQLADAFTGGYQAVAALDDKTNFLTATQRTHIRTLFEEGDAQRGRAEALKAFTEKQDAAAERERGPWKDAITALGTAYDDFITKLSNSPALDAISAKLANLASRAARAIDAVNGNRTLRDVEEDLIDNEASLNRYERLKDAAGDPLGGIGRQIQQLRENEAKLNAERKRLKDAAAGQAGGATPGTAATGKTGGDPRSTSANAVVNKEDQDALHRLDIEGRLQALRDKGQQDGLTKREQAQRIELAGQLALNAATSSAVGQAQALVDKAHERAKIAKEQEAVEKRNAAEREKAINQFEGRVIGAEGGSGKNPYSSASGFGQFTEKTFLAEYKKLNPDDAAGKTDAQILALRGNLVIAKGVVDQFARENAKFLESFGAKVTAGNLYLAHFLGAAGAKRVLTADADTPIDQLLSQDVINRNKQYLRTDNGKGRPRTAGELQTFIGNRVGDTGQAQSAAIEAVQKLADESKKKQDDLNLAIKQGNDARELGTAIAKEEAPLQYTALLAAQKRAAVEQAVLEVRKQAENAAKNLKPGETAPIVTDEQIAKVRALAAAEFDAKHARDLLTAQSDETKRDLSALDEQRQILLQQRDLLRSIGDFKGAQAVQSQINAIDGEIRTVYDKLIDFFQSLTPAQAQVLGYTAKQLQNIIDKLKQAKQAAAGLPDLLGGLVPGRAFIDAFSGAAANSFNNFLKNVSSGKNVFKSFAEGIREFAAEFAASIADLIVKTLAFALALKALSAITGIPVSVLAAAATASAAVKHTGGIAGDGGTTRQVNPTVFRVAPRYHSGGIAGLAPNEVPAILERGEEVLTRSDPRHRANGGGQGGGSQPITIVNATDHAAALEAALRSPAGGRVLLNHVQDNQRAFKAVIGG